jgi:hypothetical protein
MEATDAKGKARRYLPYAMILAAYVFIGALASHPFDDAIYAQNAQLFYLFKVPPIFVLPMGLYFDFIDIGGYFFTIILSLFHIQNVITIQLGVKIPFIMLSFLTSFVVYKMGRELGFNGRYASLVLLTSPMYVFIALIYGSAIIVSVFFLIASLLFMVRRRTTLSAILYGMSMGSYIYPIFAIPFILRYYWVREGRKKSILFLVVSSAFAAIGQLSIILLFYLKGLGAQAPLSIAGYLAPLTFLPPYSPLDILNIFGLGGILPGETIKIIYYGSTILASFIYFALPRERVNVTSLIVFLFIQGIIFSSLFPNNIPSYMAAEIPLAIIVAFMLRRWIFIGLMWISSFFGFWVMQSINSVGFIIYFSDLNQKILNVKNLYPSWVMNLAGSIYAISILLNILFLRKKKEKRDFVPRKTVGAQYSVIGAIAITAIVILVPVMSSVPAVMFLTPQVNTFEAQEASFAIVDGNLVVNYSMPLILEYGNFQGKYVSGFIYYNQTSITLYNYSTTHLMSGTNSYNISFPYPIEDALLSLFSPANVSLSAYLEEGGRIYLPSNSSITRGAEFVHSFYFPGILDGNFSLSVESSGQYFSSQTSPALKIEGKVAAEGIMIGNQAVNGIVPASLISDKMTLHFLGKFMKPPPILPQLYIAVNTVGPAVYYPYAAFGGLIFAGTVIFAVVFLRRI